MSEKVLRVRMLGGFSLHYGDKAIAMNKERNSKSLRLLQMLFLSFPGGIAKDELIENLYGWNEKVNLTNNNRNLNNLIYRLKRQLVSCGLPEEGYVEINDGMCSFKSSFFLEIDANRFVSLVKEALKTEGERRVELLVKANGMYSGELLPSNSSDMWFFQKSNYYKELYMQTVRELEKGYLEKGDYKNRLLLYSRVMAIYPFENWQVQMIRCNLEMERYKEALDVYEQTMELYAREMVSLPMAEMQECFEEMESHHGRNFQRTFAERRNDIEKAIFEENIKGAYYCTYPGFVDYCRLVVRAKKRNKFSAVLIFLTLSHNGSRKTQKPVDFQEQMELLKKVIDDSLRVGDAYTRYRNRHFILMLTRVQKESCSAIFRRIEKAYIEKGGKGELWYYTDMTQELE